MAISPSLSEVDGGPGSSYPPSVFSELAKILRTYPRRVAIICTHQPADHLWQLAGRLQDHAYQTNRPSSNCLEWTFEELHHAALRVVVGLRAQGVKAGSTVATMTPNGVEWTIMLWASILGQFALASLDFGVATPPRMAELTSLLSALHTNAVCVHDAQAAAVVDQAQSSLEKNIICKVVLDSQAPRPEGWTVLNDFQSVPVSTAMKDQIEQDAQTDDMQRRVLVVFTSGTSTGQPKGCAKTVQNTLHSTIYQTWGHDCGASTRQ